MRLQSVNLTNDGIQITYLDDTGINPNTGIIDAHILDIPHALLPQEFLDDLIDSARTIIDHARVANRQPAESFRAPR